jgi:hypothetical protein
MRHCTQLNYSAQPRRTTRRQMFGRGCLSRLCDFRWEGADPRPAVAQSYTRHVVRVEEIATRFAFRQRVGSIREHAQPTPGGLESSAWSSPPRIRVDQADGLVSCGLVAPFSGGNCVTTLQKN